MACPRCGSDRPELRLSSDNGRTHCGHGWHHYCNATDCERCNGKIRPEDIVARELRRDGISADLAYGDAHDILAALAAAGFVVRPLPDDGPPPVPYDQHEREVCGVIEERDRNEEWADKLAFALGGPAIGEHSSMNNPWQNALDNPLVRPLPDDETRRRLLTDIANHLAVEPDWPQMVDQVPVELLRRAAAYLTEGPSE